MKKEEALDLLQKKALKKLNELPETKDLTNKIIKKIENIDKNFGLESLKDSK